MFRVDRMTDEEKSIERVLKERVASLQEEGTCPTCRSFQYGDVYPDDGRVFYEDDRIMCLFEQYPRALGHTIILTKVHYEDISEMPLDLGRHIFDLTKDIISHIKEKLGAEKVYMCTMCDGKRNHLHFQLLPRYPGETIGSKNFVRPRGILKNYKETVSYFKQALRRDND